MQQDPPQLRFATTHLTTGPRLHYAEQGNPTGEAIIFLHGYSDSWFSFSRVLPLLSPAYHAFAFSQRGHGDSERPECCYTVDDFAADVDAFMDAVGITEATLVGHSGGGLMTQRVALSYPHRITRLVLIGTATTLLNNEVVMELGQEMLALEDPVPPEFVREFQESTIHHPVPEEFLETVVSESLKLPARVWRDYFEGMVLTVDHAAQLGEINVPTLKVYPETGHAVHWERPEQVVRDLEVFMKDTRPA